MNKEKVMEIISNEFEKGAACTVVTNKSADSAMRKGSKDNRNPYLGRVEVETVYSGFVMGTDYQRSIENTAKRMGNEAEASLKKVWHEFYNEWFNTDRKTRSKFYLKLQRNEQQKGLKVTREYKVDGRNATASEVAEIKSWMTAKSDTLSSTQVEMGIDKEHEQHFMLLGIETIELIKQGDRVVRPKSLLTEVTTIEVSPSFSPSLAR